MVHRGLHELSVVAYLSIGHRSKLFRRLYRQYLVCQASGKPSVAIRMTGLSRRSQGRTPNRWCASHSPASSLGTAAALAPGRQETDAEERTHHFVLVSVTPNTYNIGY